MTRRDIEAEETVCEVPNVHYVTRNTYGDDAAGEFDAHALPHPSLHRLALQTDEIRLHSASSHMHSSCDPRFQLPLSNPYQGLQDACNSHQPAAVPGGSDPVTPCPAVHSSSRLLRQLAVRAPDRFLLYTFLLFIAVIVSINSALIIWIMSVMRVTPVCLAPSIRLLHSLCADSSGLRITNWLQLFSLSSFCLIEMRCMFTPKRTTRSVPEMKRRVAAGAAGGDQAALVNNAFLLP